MGIFQIAIIILFTLRIVFALEYHGKEIKIYAENKIIQTVTETLILYFGGFFN